MNVALTPHTKHTTIDRQGYTSFNTHKQGNMDLFYNYSVCTYFNNFIQSNFNNTKF